MIDTTTSPINPLKPTDSKRTTKGKGIYMVKSNIQPSHIYTKHIMRTVKFVVDGEVQGKTYRPHVVAKARKHKVGGYVKNLPDGTVKIVCSGDETTINVFHEDIKEEIGKELKDCLADVAHVSDPEEIPPEEHKYFTIKYGETNEEIAEGLATGAAYIREIRGDIGGVGTQIKTGFDATNRNFRSLGDKYHVISGAIIIQTLLLPFILIALVLGL